MKTHFKQLAAFGCMLLLFACNQRADVISLAGEWRFRLDPEDAGVKEQWYSNTFTEHINLPGSLQEQGYGDDVDVNTEWTGSISDKSWFNAPEYAKYREKGNIKIPFWLQPDKHYVGVAWYQKTIKIPSGWAGKTIELELERTHWETSLYVDDVETGKQESLSTPHRYLLTDLKPGKHLISLRVDNRVNIAVGSNSHSVSDHTQSNWNGIVGKLSLSVKPDIYIDDVQLYPDVASKTVKVTAGLKGKVTGTSKLKLQLETMDGKILNTAGSIDIPPGTLNAEGVLEAGNDALLWSEHQPNLYRVRARIESSGGEDESLTQFGFRNFKQDGTRFSVNGQPVFLRGTLECCIFPKTGYPSLDTKYWEKIYRTCKEFGLNHMRFHSWCPPEVAFAVADSMGIYLQVECSTWANFDSSIGNGEYIDSWVYAESDRILKEYGNHPSFCMLVYGNEPRGANQGQYLTDLVAYWKQKDQRRVYSSAAGWPYVENANYWNAPNPRIYHRGNVLNDQAPSLDFDWRDIIRKDMPTVSHEIGQWCVYPNFKEIEKYTGVLKAKNFEIFKETLEAAHMGDLSDDFLYASGRLQTLCYKAEIEAALRTPGFAGFQLLDLHDFPGQGSALVGVLDPFWDTKGYVDGKEYSTFCNQTVPLVRFPKMVWLNTETLNIPVELAHFGSAPISNAKIVWKIKDATGQTLVDGLFTKDLPLDNCIEVGNIEFPLQKAGNQAKQLTVSVAVEGTEFHNQWNIWVYPAEKTKIEKQPYIATGWNDAVINRLNNGESVLLLSSKGGILPEKGGDIGVVFSSIFWNTAWFGNQPRTLGVFCDPKHPALASFPNEGYSDFQWWDIIMNCDAINMNDFPADFRPIVHLVDDWFTNRKLGILFEAKVGKGKLMVCSADLQKNLQDRPAAAQFRQSILEYMASGNFNPSKELSFSAVKNLYVTK